MEIYVRIIMQSNIVRESNNNYKPERVHFNIKPITCLHTRYNHKKA